jgi:recombination protein U
MNNFANRGMGLEKLINLANDQYAKKGIANIKKVSTPWKVIRKGPKIVNAFPEGPSTVDYMGEARGIAICFEAKQTKSKTSFPLKNNFESHQIEFMRSWQGQKFALIEFTEHNEIYYLPWIHLLNWWNSDERKSIPYSFFQQRWLVHQGNGIVLDYLEHIGMKEEAV